MQTSGAVKQMSRETTDVGLCDKVSRMKHKLTLPLLVLSFLVLLTGSAAAIGAGDDQYFDPFGGDSARSHHHYRNSRYHGARHRSNSYARSRYRSRARARYRARTRTRRSYMRYQSHANSDAKLTPVKGQAATYRSSPIAEEFRRSVEL